MHVRAKALRRRLIASRAARMAPSGNRVTRCSPEGAPSNLALPGQGRQRWGGGDVVASTLRPTTPRSGGLFGRRNRGTAGNRPGAHRTPDDRSDQKATNAPANTRGRHETHIYAVKLLRYSKTQGFFHIELRWHRNLRTSAALLARGRTSAQASAPNARPMTDRSPCTALR